MKRDYIETHLGMRVYLPNCEQDSIHIEDIAHALSLMPRFCGHLREHYSVAEHSIWVAELVSPEHKMQALLHDATEAYLCDIPTPFKQLMPEYKAAEDDVWCAIAKAYDVPEVLHPEVKHADRVMLMTERDVLKDSFGAWSDEYENTPRAKNWKPLRMWGGLRRATPQYVEKLFLDKFYAYV